MFSWWKECSLLKGTDSITLQWTLSSCLEWKIGFSIYCTTIQPVPVDFSVMTASQTHTMTVISLDVKMRQMKSSLSFKPSKIRYQHTTTASSLKTLVNSIEDLNEAFAKYRGAYHIGSKSKTSEARKRKEQRKKSKNHMKLLSYIVEHLIFSDHTWIEGSHEYPSQRMRSSRQHR